jgi:hypothetical protein
MPIPQATLPECQPLGRWIVGYDGPDLGMRRLRDDARTDPDWPADGDYAELLLYLRDEHGAGKIALGALDRSETAQRVTSLRPTSCELKAFNRPYHASDSEHTFHVAIVSYGCGRTDEEVVAVLERDPVTARRWGSPRRRQLRAQEIATMLPRARAAARPCGQPHQRVVP